MPVLSSIHSVKVYYSGQIVKQRVEAFQANMAELGRELYSSCCRKSVFSASQPTFRASSAHCCGSGSCGGGRCAMTAASASRSAASSWLPSILTAIAMLVDTSPHSLKKAVQPATRRTAITCSEWRCLSAATTRLLFQPVDWQENLSRLLVCGCKSAVEES